MSVFDPIIVQRPARKLDPLFQGMLGIVPPPVLWFTRDDLEKAGIKPDTNLFLGVTEGTGNGHFAVRVTADDAARIGQHHPIAPASDFRALASGGVLAAEDVAVAGLARSLFAWHDSARHCGWCGAPTVAVDGGWKRRCAPCAKNLFPRLDPVVIMLVSDGAYCVLAHEPRYADRMFSAIAGYIEPGEDIAHAVKRETFEELGIPVANVTVVQSQPWPFPHSLMIGCTAQTGTPGLPPPGLTIDPLEITEARWFSRAEAAHMLASTHPDGLWVPGPQAIAHHLIRAFVNDRLDVIRRVAPPD